MALDRLRYLRRCPWRDLSLPAELAGVPTMLSKRERLLLYTLARDYAKGDAAIIDAGCFLGGSTVALLRGVRDRPESWTGPPVASYDLFRVEEYTLAQFFRDDPTVRVGDSFRQRFDENVAGFGVPHVVHEGDIIEIGWSGEPIDVLFLDILKSWEINDAVLKDFFPSLLPGRSVIVHQDYGWGYTPWIPITVELMRDSLSLIDGMEWGSHVFLLEREIPEELMEKGIGSFDLDEKLELIDRAVGHTDGWVRGMTEISRTALLVERDGAEAGVRDLARIAERYSDYPIVLACLAHVNETVPPFANQRSWTARLAGARSRLAGAVRRG